MAEEKDLEVVDVKPDSENHESKKPKKKKSSSGKSKNSGSVRSVRRTK